MTGVDLLLSGGSILCPHDVAGPPPTHVAVTGGRIVAVGGPEVADLAGPHTAYADLGGGLLVPGFQDAHVHPVQGGLERLSCDLSGLDSEPAYVKALADHAAARRDLEWLTGGGWMLAAFPGGLPRREALDAVVPDRPVMLVNRDHHGAWVNTAALHRAGVDASTADPADGRIERDSDGMPTGTLHEGAMALVGRLVPPAGLDEQVAALLTAQEYLHSLGITAWQDAILGEYATIPDASAAYAACADDGRLTARVVGALWWDRARGGEQVRELVERRAAWSRGRFQATSVKIMQDGIAENYTAAMLEPYLDASGRATSNRGLSMVDPDRLAGHITALDVAGFQVHVHAIGDRAVREALDGFAAAQQANGRTDGRHHIAHLQVVHPSDVPRFAGLGVTANLQALWAAHEDQMDVLTLPFLEPQTASRQYPFGALARAGARIAMGSDWPVSSPNPLWAIHVAVNRSLPAEAGEPGEAFLPGEALDVATALRAYTAGSAWVNHLDDTGEIRAGARADLAVLDTDIRVCPAEEIGSARVVATYVDGGCVFSA